MALCNSLDEKQARPPMLGRYRNGGMFEQPTTDPD